MDRPVQLNSIERPFGKGLKGWRRSMYDGQTQTHGKNRWLATVRPDGPGSYMASVAKHFDSREAAQATAALHAAGVDGWTSLVWPTPDARRGPYRLVLSRSFADADEAMVEADGVMG